MNPQKIYFDIFESPIGKIYLLSNSKGLLKISFSKKAVIKIVKNNYSDFILEEGNIINNRTKKYFSAYFAKKRININIPFFIKGSEFYQKVWFELLKIPYGKVVNYKDIAEKLNIKKGFQAVGQALKNNPFPIIIPCHRVIKSNGEIGGYNGGVNKKKFLLKHEGYLV